ncbi:DUF3024 domain-containing protein [Myxococcota bacterium]|nr:DUF3024 domain-containing protein [Myxococcota bacterium]MBU1380577.1 DUF3024 domain-containing protein [Myxococcota bacterium]MBU1497155.1 DUF3024 domain-containing protein [Myxococcota bacterium]
MALNNDFLLKIQSLMDEFIARRRPPEDIRNLVDLFYRIENQSVVIIEKRQRYDCDEYYDFPIAKATYIESRKQWKIFWMRSDEKWHGYKPLEYCRYLSKFIKTVDEDKYHCFWG